MAHNAQRLDIASVWIIVFRLCWKIEWIESVWRWSAGGRNPTKLPDLMQVCLKLALSITPQLVDFNNLIKATFAGFEAAMCHKPHLKLTDGCKRAFSFTSEAINSKQHLVLSCYLFSSQNAFCYPDFSQNLWIAGQRCHILVVVLPVWIL